MGWYARDTRGNRPVKRKRASNRGQHMERLETRWAFSIDLAAGIAPDADFAITSEPRIAELGDEPGVIAIDLIDIVDPIERAPAIETVLDDQQRVIKEVYEFDTDGDQVVDLRTIAEYGYADGSATFWTRYSEDQGADGTIDYVSSSESVYDEAGNLVESSSAADFDGDGTLDHSWHSAYKYNELGQLVSSVETSDENGDGIADSIWTSSITIENGLVTVELQTSDYDADGQADYVYQTTYAYDADGVMVSITSEADENGDGTFESVTVTDPRVPIYDKVDGVDGDWVVISLPEIVGDPRAEDWMYMTGNVEEIALRGEPVLEEVIGDDTLPVDIVTDPIRRTEIDEQVIVTFGPGGTSGPLGDVSGDGIFDSQDLVLLFQLGLYEQDNSGNAEPVTGDFDGDGQFGTSDLVMAFQAGGYIVGAEESSLFASLMDDDSEQSSGDDTSNQRLAFDSIYADDTFDPGIDLSLV